ncbi:hypothetical protein QYF36_027119 [Acer negundo]|nr:hypothetical protein QYF36_027119 [Acer negundo]
MESSSDTVRGAAAVAMEFPATDAATGRTQLHLKNSRGYLLGKRKAQGIMDSVTQPDLRHPVIDNSSGVSHISSMTSNGGRRSRRNQKERVKEEEFVKKVQEMMHVEENNGFLLLKAFHGQQLNKR